MKTLLYLCLVISLISPVLADQKPLLSLVIDDLGYSLNRGKAAIDLPGHNTYAIIPGTIYGKRLAEYARENNQEYILHLPLQAANQAAAAEGVIDDLSLPFAEVAAHVD